MLTIIAKLLKALNSEQQPWQLALALSFASILGLTPLWSLHNLVVLFLLLLVRVNLSLVILSYPLFATVGWLASSAFENVGLYLLQQTSWQDFWTALYNHPLGRWLGMDYSARLGSLAVATGVALLLLPVASFLIRMYREKLLSSIKHTRLMTYLGASRLWQLYKSMEG